MPVGALNDRVGGVAGGAGAWHSTVPATCFPAGGAAGGWVPAGGCGAGWADWRDGSAARVLEATSNTTSANLRTSITFRSPAHKEKATNG